MAAKKKKMAVANLATGMFVCELDRPWCRTPFPLQGFFITNAEDIVNVKRFCEYVYIDVPLSRDSYQSLSATTVADKPSNHLINDGKRTGSLETGPDSNQANSESAQVAPIKINSPVAYNTRSPMRKAYTQAVKLMDDVDSKIRNLYQAVEQSQRFDLQTTRNIACELVNNVTDNPDALVWLTRMQNKDEHTYYHAVSASIWGLVLGRQLGLDKETLETVATGLLLSQIGKAKFPAKLLKNPDHLSAREYLYYQRFVMESVRILMQDPAISPQVVAVVEYHRERHNGSGFPKGITGDRIPLLGKIAGLVDRFQELIQPRPGTESHSPAQAMSILFQTSDIEFQADLVERFVGAIGVYPTGSIVELNSGDIAVVVHPNEGRKLWPTIILIEQKSKKKKLSGKLINLKEYNEKQEYASRYVQITRTLPQNSFDIDADELLAVSSGKWSLGNLFRH